ncbi:SHOCT domain-containing protein [Kitasatospora sp. NPDC101801]|uniref:SHOCT domain-containing protein n=1 Tax=Kitasatospora sp. NPDC101801 TaxID=3364103 RepID=UPI0037FCF71C
MFRPMRPIRPIRVVRPVGAPLVRGLVVGGAAYAAGRSAARSSRDEQDQNAAIADLQAQQAPPPVYQAPAYQPPPAAAQPDLASKLTELGQMVQQGLLTPEEFATAKARLLASG